MATTLPCYTAKPLEEKVAGGVSLATCSLESNPKADSIPTRSLNY